jgi:GST-like protein
VKELFDVLQGNTFQTINHPVVGPKFEKKLPCGKKAIQLYSLASVNGQKVGICLEEMQLDYDSHVINIAEGEQYGSDFVSINPNAKIPAMIFKEEDGAELKLFESSAILQFLAKKYQKFVPQSKEMKSVCLCWLAWQASGFSPFHGQFFHFWAFSPKENVEAKKYGLARYGLEVQRQYSVLNRHLEKKEFVCDKEYTIVDMAVYPWVKAAHSFPGIAEFLELEQYGNVQAWLARMDARPKVQAGMKVCAIPNWGNELQKLQKRVDDLKETPLSKMTSVGEKEREKEHDREFKKLEQKIESMRASECASEKEDQKKELAKGEKAEYNAACEFRTPGAQKTASQEPEQEPSASLKGQEQPGILRKLIQSFTGEAEPGEVAETSQQQPTQ